MRVGVLSDLHGNWPALSAVAADLPAVDALLCAGDVVGYNPWPAACVAWLRERAVPTVMGNHDRMVAGEGSFLGNPMASAGVEYARDALDDEELDWLASLPDEHRLFDGRLAVVHGHPEDPDRYTYTEEFDAGMLGEEDVLVLGHTHVQGHRQTPAGLICNPGSVGQPRDGDPRAAYAVVDLAELTVDEHRVEYDVDRVLEAVEGTDLPRRTATRLREGR